MRRIGKTIRATRHGPVKMVGIAYKEDLCHAMPIYRLHQRPRHKGFVLERWPNW
jgi:hypothetical protein